MNDILIIGNGFDIYHGLPTRYSDFLFLAENWEYFYKKYGDGLSEKNDKQINVRLNGGKLSKDSLSDFAQYKNIFCQESIEYLNENITQNAWINYFKQIKFDGKGWVDFEAEIDDALHAIDTFFEKLPSNVNTRRQVKYSTIISSDIQEKTRFFLTFPKININKDYFGFIKEADAEEYKLKEIRVHIIDKLKEELDILNECLRLYLLEFVEHIKCEVYSQQIKALPHVKLLNFNYTSTCKKMYASLLDNINDGEHSVHGNCSNGGIVLGIPDDSFSEKLEYIYFVKYFQRIQKRTGNFYKEWITSPEYEVSHNLSQKVFIMGHSLASTDKGILKKIFYGRGIEKIVIFYHDQEAYENMIINLVKMFGKEFVIEQIGNERIIFEQLTPPKQRNR